MLSLCVCEIIVVVCVREAAGGEGVPEKEPGIQNQKQEPHTKMWGKNEILPKAFELQLHSCCVCSQARNDLRTCLFESP